MSHTAPSSRFACPTSDLNLDGLLGRLRRVFWLSLGASLLAHVILVGINPFERALERTPRPLTTKFIKREPRLTKPLELRKRPQPKRQMIRRQVQVVQARMDQVQAAATFDARSVISLAAAPEAGLARAVDFQAMNLEPQLDAAAITGTREPENRIDMALEMLDVNSMDTGRYRAMVVQDPNDRQAIKGFINFASVLSARSVAAGTVGYASIGTRDVDALVDAVNEYTGLQARFIGQVTYDDERLLDVPIIVPVGVPNESELEHLAHYLLAGGFVFGAYWPEALEKYGGLVAGQDFWQERLTDDHPVFSSFFDIKGGGALSGAAPSGNEKQGMASWQYITGYFIKGRLSGVVFSHGFGWRAEAHNGDSTRQRQMAVNIIVYALTQEGSITQRLMQMVK